jgi:putative DNA primase/helicase
VLGGVESLTVAVDHDRAGLDALNALAARWLASGREVRQWLPPEHGADLNDWLGSAAA